MKTNTKHDQTTVRTHEGSPAKTITDLQELRRSVLSCMLWEDQFYENGVAIAQRIADLSKKVKPQEVEALAIEAREKMHLRHVPLHLLRSLAKDGKMTANTLTQVIQRPDEIMEFVSLYWSDGKQSLSGQVKKGLAGAFNKFNEYNFAKYNRDAKVKLRDVLFLCHPKPKDAAQQEIFNKIVNKTLKTADTWENALSTGENKRESFERLMKEGNLGGLAFLRNLRNMREFKCDEKLVKSYFDTANFSRVLPFRFIAAARYAPNLEPELEKAMFKGLENHAKLDRKTYLLIDVSGSMDWKLSDKSDMMRLDAACALSMLVREICDDVEVHTFSHNTVLVPPRRGFALRDAIVQSQQHGGTYLGQAVKQINSAKKATDRLIVFTDEQSHDTVPGPNGLGYMINVASYQNGVGYGPWTHVDGFSEAIVDWILALEKSNY